MSKHQGAPARARWFDVLRPWRRRPAATTQLRGHLDLNDSREPVVHGWLAMPGEDRPRTALLHIDGVSFRILADRHRVDLEQHGINQGNHSFKLTVPPELTDGLPHDVVLYDDETGSVLGSGRCRWGIPRVFTDFDGFLRASLTLPLMPLPFREEDKRVFAVSDNIATLLAEEGMAAADSLLVSVVMPVRDRAGTVGAAVRSVLSQTFSQFELIIVDDGSVDDTRRKILSFKDERVRVIVMPESQGVSRARNVALRAAHGSIIAYLDSDNTWDERYLAAMVGAYLRKPEAQGWYCGQLLYRGTAASPYAVRFGAFNRALVENRNYIDLNAFCHTRDVGEAVGGFDVRLRRYVDWDLILRITEVGPVFSVPVLLSRYVYDSTPNTLTNESAFIADLDVVRSGIQERASARVADRGATQLARQVTVIIPSYEALFDLQACVGALLATADRDNLHIVIVDNASSAPVVDYLRELETAEQITLIANDMNYGFSHAVNQGLSLAHPNSDVFLLNNDAIVEPDAISVLQAAAYELPDCGLVAPRQILPGGTRTIEMHVPYADGMQACDVNLSAHHANVLGVPLLHDGGPLELSFAPFFAVYIRRDVLDIQGRLDAGLGRHYRSDRIFCDVLRGVWEKRIFYLPDARVHHKLQRSTDELLADPQACAANATLLTSNSWGVDMADRLGYRRAEWDV